MTLLFAAIFAALLTVGMAVCLENDPGYCYRSDRLRRKQRRANAIGVCLIVASITGAVLWVASEHARVCHLRGGEVLSAFRCSVDTLYPRTSQLAD